MWIESHINERQLSSIDDKIPLDEMNIAIKDYIYDEWLKPR